MLLKLLDILKRLWLNVSIQKATLMSGSTISGWKGNGTTWPMLPDAWIPMSAMMILQHCPRTSQWSGTRHWPSQMPLTPPSTTLVEENVSKFLSSFHEFLHWVLNFKTKSRIFVSKESLDQGFLHPWVEGAMGAPSSQKHTKNYSLLKTNCFAPLIRGSNASPWGHTLTDKTFEGLSISRHNCSIYWRFLAQPLFVLSGQHA